MNTCSLATWDMDSREEPSIRVGIILPQDDMRQVRFSLPSDPYRLWLDDMPGQILQSCTLEAAMEGERLLIKNLEQTVGTAGVVRFIPEKQAEPKRGTGVLLRQVMSGRGFHWEKRIHPTFPGMIEFRVQNGYLLVVNEVPLEHYLVGVLTSEMSGDCPVEFLKSQIIVARSWVLAFTENKHPDLPIDRCNDDDCQRYMGTTYLTDTALEAMRSTRGQILIDANREIIDANYSKGCGGISETPENTWSVAKSGLRAAVDAPKNSLARRFFPVTEANLDEYLTGEWLSRTDIYCSPLVVSDTEIMKFLGKVDERGNYFRWQITYNREDLEQVLRDKFFSRYDSRSMAAMSTLADLRVTKRGLSGRAVEIEIEYYDPMCQKHTVKLADQHKIRDVLHEKFLYSSAFKVNIDRDPQGLPRHITLTGGGWGHGVGLCQIGALGMAIKGHTCEDILQHYFEGITINACYS